MFSDRPMSDWVAQYARSHQHPVNRLCHTVGIPLVAGSILLAPLTPFLNGSWRYVLGAFVVGWAFQFIGHAFERKRPEFFSDWRFLFVGLRWWFAKIRGAA